MKLSFKVCELCNGPLAVRKPRTRYDEITSYICDKQIDESKLSHYYIEVNGSLWTQIIHLPPYTVINSSDKETSDIYPYQAHNDGEDGLITHRKKILSIPRIPVTSPTTLTERLKLLILFS